MKYRVFSAITVGVILMMSGCDSKAQEPGSVATKASEKTAVSTEKTTAVSENVVESKQKLLFFMNPHGTPCIMQDQVLTDMDIHSSTSVEVEYVKTTEMKTARPLFMQYGVRALPTMILLNSDGSVKQRFTPGIQSAETITSALN